MQTVRSIAVDDIWKPEGSMYREESATGKTHEQVYRLVQSS
jgi:hypothetical protein